MDENNINIMSITLREIKEDITIEDLKSLFINAQDYYIDNTVKSKQEKTAFINYRNITEATD